jgi:hypothetical protein
MQSVTDSKVSIKLLEYRLAQKLQPMVKRQPIEADDFLMKLMVTNITNVLQMVTNVYPMVTDVYPMVAKESSVANPKKG